MNLRWKIAQFAELLWWRWYLWGKPAGGYLHWKRRYWSAFFRRFAMELNPAGRLLEVGSGPAGAFLILPQEHLTVVDPLAGPYRRQFAQLSGSVVCDGDLVSEPFEKWESQERFDSIYCFNAINHTADLDICVAKMAQLLRPGGRLYLSVDCHRNRFLKSLFQRIPGDILHPHQYDAGEYSQLFLRQGLILCSCRLIQRQWIFDYNLFIFEK